MSWKIPVCDGCGCHNPINFMIKDRLWQMIKPLAGPRGGFLCPPCVEQRLRRKLALEGNSG